MSEQSKKFVFSTLRDDIFSTPGKPWGFSVFKKGSQGRFYELSESKLLFFTKKKFFNMCEVERFNTVTETHFLSTVDNTTFQ